MSKPIFKKNVLECCKSLEIEGLPLEQLSHIDRIRYLHNAQSERERELLEALKEALNALGGNDPQDLGFEDSICGKIRQAIAKAEGKQ